MTTDRRSKNPPALAVGSVKDLQMMRDAVANSPEQDDLSSVFIDAIDKVLSGDIVTTKENEQNRSCQLN